MWTLAANTDEILPNQFISLYLEGFALLLFNVDGEFFALEDRCSHMDFPLADGSFDGETITCIHHGARFCVKSGEVRAAPACDAVRTFPVSVEDGRVFIDL